jgi:hypothetical protein
MRKTVYGTLCLVIGAICLGQTRTARVTIYEDARLITGDGSAIEDSVFIVTGNTFTRVGRRGQLQVPTVKTAGPAGTSDWGDRSHTDGSSPGVVSSWANRRL